MNNPNISKQTVNQMLILILFVVGFWSCQTVINVDLNSASPKLIIDASINDQPGPYTIMLSQTVNFTQNNVFPPVSGAQIVITDHAGTPDTLIEINPGTYQTTRLQGIPGRTYTLTVNSNNSNYSAICTMPQPVAIDTVFTKNELGSKNKNISIRFKDPGGIANYYRVMETVTNIIPIHADVLLPTLGTVTTDRLSDGAEITYTAAFDQPELVPGDSVLVALECIDKNIFNYFRTARQNGSMSTTVSNPVTNLTNGALGYFSAYAVRYKKIVVQ
jgi:hypothetical protein